MLRSFWQVTKTAMRQAAVDKVPRLAAALAFYTMLSLAPLSVISVRVAGVLFGRDAASGQLVRDVERFAGRQGAEAAQAMIRQPAQADSAVLVVALSAGILLFSAGSMFVELHDALNTVWGTQVAERLVWSVIRKRIMAFLLVLCAPALLLASLIASAAVTTLDRALGNPQSMLPLHLLNWGLSVMVIAAMFALAFKYLPDAPVPWRSACSGAVLGAVLFTVGKAALVWYLRRASVSGVYGAAGSLAALLIWVYYSAQIFFLAAEFTKAWADATGRKNLILL